MAQSSSTSWSNLTFLQGGGEMGARMRDLDWAKTSVSADAYVSEALGWVGYADAATLHPQPSESGQVRILLADDNADMREYVGRLLGERWRVDAVPDGAAALRAARAERPDLVVADVMMPELDGFDLLAALRADPATQAIPVILLSARAGEEAMLKGIAAGADDYLVKPFTARDLVTRVEAQFRRAHAQALARITASSEQQRRLYQTILSSTPDLVYVFDLDHRFTYANHALLKMWGITWDEAIGKNCLEPGYEPWHAEMHDREIDQVIATKQPIRGEVPFTGTQGRRIYDYIFVPVFGEDGEVEAIAGTTRDVTDYKQSEDALRESQQRLSEANRVKDEFLATLFHELRTPLNAVLGWVHMLRTGTLRPDVQVRALQSLERNAKAQAQLVDDLLDVSRIISGKLAIKKEVFDLTTVIAEAVDAVRPAVSAKCLRLGVGVAAGAEFVVDGDAARLQQVVWNLLSNAVKFTPAGGTIDVDLRNDGEHVEIIVGDSGDGIDPAFLPHVFERFRQADSATSRKHGGLGLGLSIVRHLTEAHGGTVSGQSDGPGKGATFVVRLPLEAARQRPRPATPRDNRWSISHFISGVRVLVADDEPDARELTRVVLESGGGYVVAVASAGEALNALRQQPFDALVADIGMPGQDGYSLIRAIRRLPAGAGGSIPAVAVTAYTTVREREEALTAGFNAHIGKPVDPEQLVATIAAAVSAERIR